MILGKGTSKSVCISKQSRSCVTHNQTTESRKQKQLIPTKQKTCLCSMEVNKNTLMGGQFLIFLPQNPGK